VPFCSITERNSFDELQKFYDQLSVMHEDKIPPVVICGNKCDLADKRVVTTEEGQRLANTYGAVAYIETSAKTGQNIDRVFSTLVREIRSSGGVKARNREPEKPKKRFWCSIL
jgi:GTPase SAR1 family protein